MTDERRGHRGPGHAPSSHRYNEHAAKRPARQPRLRRFRRFEVEAHWSLPVVGDVSVRCRNRIVHIADNMDERDVGFAQRGEVRVWPCEGLIEDGAAFARWLATDSRSGDT